MLSMDMEGTALGTMKKAALLHEDARCSRCFQSILPMETHVIVEESRVKDLGVVEDDTQL